MNPDDPLYGIELPGKEGILSTIDAGGQSQNQHTPGKASYLNLFEAVYQTIRANKPYPVQQEQIIRQITILKAH
ncbi:hypothetical protein CS542_05270 [Pedobacter sp. IW39]|nr:hypothetical protein CS542_05270 [Pedobacter sp. IW39]